MTFDILGQGVATPEHFATREESVRLVQECFAPGEHERRLAPALYRMAGVNKRHSVMLGPSAPGPEVNRYDVLHAPCSADDRGPSTLARMEKYEAEAGTLALRAARAALVDSATDADAVTHLITVSCSGFSAPGVDIALMKGLGLRSSVQRLHVGFMGCQGAMNGLRVAKAFAQADPKARVLLCAVELCSLHYHYGWDPEKVVANALFADGAAALVGASATGDESRWRLAASGACLVPDSEDAMTWRVGDHGFLMTLSPRVPALIETHLRAWLDGWLHEHGLSVASVPTWAVHPGGPRILTSVASALGLDPGALSASRDVLREYGNMSSPTILFILDRLRAANAPRPCVAIGFGPGLAIETALFV